MLDNPSQYPESYSQDDIQEILYLAIAAKDDRELLTRQHLLEIARELDIDGKTLEIAEKQWLEQKAIDRQRQTFNLHRRQKFRQKLTKFLIVNGFLVVLNLISAGTVSWSLYILLIWGLGLALHGWRTFQSQGEEYERAFQRWSFQNQLRQTVANVWNRLQQNWQV
ncbi:MAG: 2TM domain-containing protein [Pleurocapsa sp.]